MNRKDNGGKWQPLIDAFQEILENSFEGDFEDLRRYAGTLKHHIIGKEKLYIGLKRVINECLAKVRSKVMASSDDNFLRTLNIAWGQHKTSMVRIRSIILNTIANDDMSKMKDAERYGLTKFVDEVIRWPGVDDRLLTILLDMTEKERRGEKIVRVDLQCTCHLLINLIMPWDLGYYSMYEEDFKKPFLKKSAEFYSKESDRFLAANSEAKYVEYIEQQMIAEKERATFYLDESTMKGLVDMLETIRLRKLHLLIITRGRIKC